MTVTPKIGPDIAPLHRMAPARLVLDALRRRAPQPLRHHHRRVSAMSARLARGIGLGEAEIGDIARAGGLHDIGMALLPRELLKGRGRFSCRERELMRSHAVWAGELLALTGERSLRLAARVALEHHERWDGSGYPRGLKGEDICLGARIVAVCAVYDALRHPRPGKEARGHEAALEILCRGDAESGPNAFDPSVRAAFLGHHCDFQRISEGGAPAGVGGALEAAE